MVSTRTGRKVQGNGKGEQLDGNNAAPTATTTRADAKRRKAEPSPPPEEQTQAVADTPEQQPAVAGPSTAEPSQQDAADGHMLDAFRKHKALEAAIRHLQAQIADPLQFLRPNPELSQLARQAAQALYGLSARHLLRKEAKAQATAGGAAPALLPELYVDQFDPEQIWLQLDVATDAALRRYRRLMKKLGPPEAAPGLELIKPHKMADIDALLTGRSEGEEEEGESEEEEGEEEEEADAGARGRAKQGSSKRKRVEEDDEEDEGDDDEDEDDDFDEDDDDDEPLRSKSKSKSGSKSKGQAGVEDRFMKLSDMEKFLEDAEEEAAGLKRRKGRKGGKEDSEAQGDDEDADEDEEDDELAGLLDGVADDLAGRGGADEDDDEDDDEMEGLLADAAALVGKKHSKAKGGKKDSGMLGGAANIKYADFFGGRPGAGAEDEDGFGEEEEEEEEEGGAKVSKRKGRGAFDDEDGDMGEDGMEEEEEEEDGMEEDEEEEDGADGRQGKAEGSGAGAAGAGAGAKAPRTKLPKEALEGLSTHERRLLRMQERIAELEEDAVAEKEWVMSGEVDAQRRPLNSALEVDMDFETTVKPAPAVTEEAAADLEALIKQRIAAGQFDDVARVEPPPLEKTRKDVELDDSKSSRGLGEVYEEEFVRSTTGMVAEDKDDKLRNEARALLKSLFAKLDALSHFHFTPKPVVEEMAVKSDVAALMMEEAAPVAVSKAGMQMRGEVYKPEAEGAPQAEGEMSREDRKRRRAKRKRGAKAKKAAEAPAGGAALPSASNIVGRKSASTLDAAGGKKKGKKDKGAGSKPDPATQTRFGKSASVFGKLQEEQDRAKAGLKPLKQGGKPEAPAAKASMLKL